MCLAAGEKDAAFTRVHDQKPPFNFVLARG